MLLNIIAILQVKSGTFFLNICLTYNSFKRLFFLYIKRYIKRLFLYHASQFWLICLLKFINNIYFRKKQLQLVDNIMLSYVIWYSILRA